jgi:RimJ/RimL family protein N-acetyltransferase
MSAEYVIRPAVPDDAVGMLELMRSVADEAHNGILYSRGDSLRTLEEQRKLIEQRMASGNSMMLLAEAEGQIIGYISCIGGIINATKHTVGLAIMVNKEWRGKGIGTALMERIIEWAHGNPIIHRVELEVFTINPRAAHIYEKLGFQLEGIKRQVYFKDGQFVDAKVMAMIFEH